MEIDVKIDKAGLTATVNVKLINSTPIYEHHRTGRIIDYKNGELIKEGEIRHLVEKECPSGYVLGTKISGPSRADNLDNNNRTAIWVFGIKSLTKEPKSGKVNKTAPKTTKKKTKKSFAATGQTS
tara:strand:- start:1394 stop:1768 length:375 start_codon:yes stop_codon:yes gene_type:complete